jgi:hypothetical protein
MSSRKGQILTLVRSEGIMRLSAWSVNEPAKVKSPLTKGQRPQALGVVFLHSNTIHEKCDNPRRGFCESAFPLEL